jgi:prevent-host-death family protein
MRQGNWFPANMKRLQLHVTLHLMPAPKSITMVELRTNAEKIVRAVRRGQRMVLTYRGRPVVRLEPVVATDPVENDPFYALAELADSGGRSLTNDEIDKIVYSS